MALANRHPWKAELDMLNIEPGDGGGPSSDQGSGADSDESEDEYFCDLCATKSEDQEAINGPRWTLRPEGEYDDQVRGGARVAGATAAASAHF